MKITAIYARVSTDDKDQSTRGQLIDLRNYATLKGWTNTQEYIDEGISGGKTSRPALDRLMADVRADQIQTVLVWRFDRFSRSLKHLILTLDEFREREIGFVSLKESVGLPTP